METSAVNGKGVAETFELLINETYRVLKRNGELERSLDTSKVTGTYRAEDPKTGKQVII